MSVHYDVDKIVAGILQGLESAPLPVNPQQHMLIKLRNPDATAAIAHMYFSERNRGTDEVEIMKAIVGIMVEYLCMMTSAAPDVRPMAFGLFAQYLTNGLDQVMNNIAFKAYTVEVVPERGGHA